MNEFYNMTGVPQNSGPGVAVDIRAEFMAVQAGFDKFGGFSTLGAQILGVDAAGGALEGKGVYATGNWTPVFDFDTHGDLTIVYSSQVGKYVRIAALVLAWFDLNMTTFTHTTASGGAKITGLPYANVLAFGAGVVHFTNVTFTDLHITPYVQAGTIIQFIGATSASTDTAIGVTQFPTGSTKTLKGFVAYLA